MKYTKGKWEIDINKFREIGIVAIDGLKTSAVAEVPRVYDNAIYNAHLIAAAPDMYETLKEIQLGLALNQDNETPESLQYVIRCSLELIAKARDKAEGYEK